MKHCPDSNHDLKFQPDSKFLKTIVENICATYEDKNICATYTDEKGIKHIETSLLPNEAEVIDIIHDLLEVLFPGYTARKILELDSLDDNIRRIITGTYAKLIDQIARSYRSDCKTRDCEDCDVANLAEEASRHLLELLPEIRETIKLDAAAAYDGDPAAKSLDEIILSYPGIKAITMHRISHELYMKKVPLMPRMMSEYAHRTTGIDIHPGAQLGEGFFIDHGTGVVIGETAVIGNNVKIYQGVTIGALSFPKDSCGKIIKGLKRHPTIQDNVTIYAGATILGNIIIGEGSVIGGNVWITENIDPGSIITISAPELKIKTRAKKN